MKSLKKGRGNPKVFFFIIHRVWFLLGCLPKIRFIACLKCLYIFVVVGQLREFSDHLWLSFSLVLAQQKNIVSLVLHEFLIGSTNFTHNFVVCIRLSIYHIISCQPSFHHPPPIKKKSITKLKKILVTNVILQQIQRQVYKTMLEPSIIYPLTASKTNSMIRKVKSCPNHLIVQIVNIT